MTQVASPLPGGDQPLESGIRKTADELGATQREVQRSLRIASLSPEAQASAVELKLDNNQSALLDYATDDIKRHRLVEIAENLHRAELTALERGKLVEEWRELTCEKVVQLGPPLKGGAQPLEAGVKRWGKFPHLWEGINPASKGFEKLPLKFLKPRPAFCGLPCAIMPPQVGNRVGKIKDQKKAGHVFRRNPLNLLGVPNRV